MVSIIYQKRKPSKLENDGLKVVYVHSMCLHCANRFWYSLYWDNTLYFILCFSVFLPVPPSCTWSGSSPQLRSSYVCERGRKRESLDVDFCGRCHSCTKLVEDPNQGKLSFFCQPKTRSHKSHSERKLAPNSNTAKWVNMYMWMYFYMGKSKSISLGPGWPL